MQLHVLADNRVRKRGILAEHGLSLLIEQEADCILFDTGQTGVYARNAEQMGLNLYCVDAIVLSHGHYDHCGGLPFFPDTRPLPKVFVHPSAFLKKLAANRDGTFREIGIPWSRAFREKAEGSLIKTSGLQYLCPGVAVCPEIGGGNAAGTGFFFDSGRGPEPDGMADEQMLVFDRENDLFIFLGCSHPGVIACLRHAQKCFPGKRIGAVAGGMHLDGLQEQGIEDVIDQIKELGVQKVIPLHCTGIDAICSMKQALGPVCVPLCAGESISL